LTHSMTKIQLKHYCTADKKSIIGVTPITKKRTIKKKTINQSIHQTKSTDQFLSWCT